MGQPLTDADRDLIDDVTKVLGDHYEPGRHRTASGFRTTSGASYTSINLITSLGPTQVHCEPITIGMAVLDDETDFEISVAVTYSDKGVAREPGVVSPCGVCRELLREFGPAIDVIVPGDGEPVKVALPELLLAKGWGDA